MPQLKVTFANSVGALDSRIVADEREALRAAVELMVEAGELHDGDSITVAEVDC